MASPSAPFPVDFVFSPFRAFAAKSRCFRGSAHSMEVFRSMRETIGIKGAKENNLKNIDVDIPREKLVVLTGLSGSGKSSLAFETIYAEGQRRFLESLSAFSRKYVSQLKK